MSLACCRRVTDMPVLDEDIPRATGTQSFVATAPLSLVYMDLSKAGSGPDNELFTDVDAGFISQNVYCFTPQRVWRRSSAARLIVSLSRKR